MGKNKNQYLPLTCVDFVISTFIPTFSRRLSEETYDNSSPLLSQPLLIVPRSNEHALVRCLRKQGGYQAPQDYL